MTDKQTVCIESIVAENQSQLHMLSHQDCSEDSGADAVSHLKLSFFVGSREVVVPPGTKHPENQQQLSVKTAVSVTLII